MRLGISGAQKCVFLGSQEVYSGIPDMTATSLPGRSQGFSIRLLVRAAAVLAHNLADYARGNAGFCADIGVRVTVQCQEDYVSMLHRSLLSTAAVISVWDVV